MFDSRLRRLIGGVALAAMLLWPASGVAVAAGGSCTMTVDPASGPPGTQFTFAGSGYTPTEFRLTQGKTTRTVAVDLSGADPWTYSFVAAEGDVGHWKVVAAVGTTGCTATAAIHVALPSTSTIDPSGSSDKMPALAALAGMAAVFVVSAGLIFRRSRLLA